jgi:hypothetical protein
MDFFRTMVSILLLKLLCLEIPTYLGIFSSFETMDKHISTYENGVAVRPYFYHLVYKNV